jgi:hypothetical protein
MQALKIYADFNDMQAGRQISAGRCGFSITNTLLCTYICVCTGMYAHSAGSIQLDPISATAYVQRSAIVSKRKSSVRNGPGQPEGFQAGFEAGRAGNLKAHKARAF